MKRITISLAKLNRIANNLITFYKSQFNSPEEEYQANKNAKEQVGQLIIHVKRELGLSRAAQQQVVNEALMLLAKSTGCVADEQIAENMLDKLHLQSKVIDQQDLDRYYAYKQSRWD